MCREPLIMTIKLTIILTVWITLFFACTSLPPPAPEKPGSKLQDAPKDLSVPPVLQPQVQEPPSIKTVPQDEELFMQGLRQIANPSATPAEHGQARQAFEHLLITYPKSPWHDAALLGLDLLNTMGSYRDKLRADQESRAKLSTDYARALQEIEELKKDIRSLQEKYQGELAENEQLKKDIQLLKNLEIQLDKREKQLR